MAENRKDVDGGCSVAQDDLRESGRINRCPTWQGVVLRLIDLDTTPMKADAEGS